MLDDDRLWSAHAQDLPGQLPDLILNRARVLIEETAVPARVARDVDLRDEPGIDPMYPLNRIEPLVEGVHPQRGHIQQQSATGLFADLIQKIGLAHRRVRLNRRRNGLEKQRLLAHVHHFDDVIDNDIQAGPAETEGQVRFPGPFIRSAKTDGFGNPRRVDTLDDGGKGADTIRRQGTGCAERKPASRNEGWAKTANRIDQSGIRGVQAATLDLKAFDGFGILLNPRRKRRTMQQSRARWLCQQEI